MTDASAQYEQMPDAMHKAGLPARIEDHADRIEQTAEEQKQKAVEGYQLKQRFDSRHNRPAHQQVKDQGKVTPPCYADRIGYNSKNRKEQIDTKNGPSQFSSKQG